MNELKEIPQILYKYRNYNEDNHKRLLYNLEMYFPSTEQFNDPFEGNIPYVFHEDEFTPEKLLENVQHHVKDQYPHLTGQEFQKECKRIIDEGNFKDPENLDRIKEISKERIKTSFGIFSLARDRDNFLMWSHYSNEHTGFCIGFDMDNLWEAVKEPLFSVDYKKELPKIRFNEDPKVLLQKILTIKGDMWAYENEYRIINFQGPRTKMIIPSNSIKEVVLGCAMEPEVKKEIVSYIKSTHSDWDIFETKLSESKFELVINRIPHLGG